MFNAKEGDMVNEKDYSPITLVIPKDLIIGEEAHPEPYGEKIVILENGMWTDVYTDDNGNYYTITNDNDLIEYIKSKIKK